MAKNIKVLRITRDEFHSIVIGRKLSVIRPSAEKYKVGDALFLREYDKRFTGGIAIAEITKLVEGYMNLGTEFQILSFDLVWSKLVDDN